MLSINRKSLHYKFVNYLYINDWLKERPETLFGYIFAILFFSFVLILVLGVAIALSTATALSIASNMFVIDTKGFGVLWYASGVVLIAIIYVLQKLITKAKNITLKY